ncbi:MAG: hypothetical protein WCG25_02060 [bacterium]
MISFRPYHTYLQTSSFHALAFLVFLFKSSFVKFSVLQVSSEVEIVGITTSQLMVVKSIFFCSSNFCISSVRANNLLFNSFLLSSFCFELSSICHINSHLEKVHISKSQFKTCL